MEYNKEQQKRVTIVTNNCHCERHVQYYSTVEKYFKINGWSIKDDFSSDKIVFCGCGFIDSMYERIDKSITELKLQNYLEKNIIIMGCLPKTHERDLKEKFKGYIIELHKEDEVDEIIKASVPFSEIKNVHVFRRHLTANPNMFNEKFHIKISEGCLRKCTFCVINKVKGYIRSFPKEEIFQQVKEAVELGYLNIMFIGEDTFAYGVDIETNIIELIRYIKANEPRVNLSFGYLHIQWLAKYSNEIINLCKEGLISHLHIGLQHVSNSVLSRMGRAVNFTEIYKTICAIKQEIPNFEFGADIMVGFPGETKDDFNELLKFFKNDKCFTKVQHFGYSDVKGAPSNNFSDKNSSLEIVERWEELNKVLGSRAYSNELNERTVDDETFKMTRFEEIFYCKDTFYKEIENLKIVPNKFTKANASVLHQTDNDFNFS